LPLLHNVSQTVRKWANRVSPLEVDISLPGSIDPDTREWVPGGWSSTTIRALCLSTASVSSSLGLQFQPSQPITGDEQDIFVPVGEDGVIRDTNGQPAPLQVQGDNQDGSRVYPQGRTRPFYEIVQEVADFSTLGGFRWFRARRSPQQ
jgi:hypothetical protein